MEKSRLLQGYLLTSSAVELTRDNLLRSSSLRLVGQIEQTKWDEYRFRSPTPLRGEEQLNLSGSFEYIVLCRRSGSRVLILSETLVILDFLLKQEATLSGNPKLKRMSIGVDALVKAITKSPGRYLLSRVDALVPTFGQSLRSISFYGEDIGEATFFRNNIDLMQCYGCGLREVSRRGEVLRLVNKGIVSFLFMGPKKVLEVEKALRFVSGQEALTFI